MTSLYYNEYITLVFVTWRHYIITSILYSCLSCDVTILYDGQAFCHIRPSQSVTSCLLVAADTVFLFDSISVNHCLFVGASRANFVHLAGGCDPIPSVRNSSIQWPKLIKPYCLNQGYSNFSSQGPYIFLARTQGPHNFFDDHATMK